MSTNSLSLISLRHLTLAVALAGGFGYAQAAEAVANAPVSATVKSSERVASDSWITTKVKSEIMSSSVAKGFKVHVKTLHGAVTLKGKLASRESVDEVKAIVEKVAGVKSVDASSLTIAAQ